MGILKCIAQVIAVSLLIPVAAVVVVVLWILGAILGLTIWIINGNTALLEDIGLK